MAKATSPIPPGFHSVSVHLVVDGAAAYIEFLKKAFGAVEIQRSSPGPGGKLMHVQMKIGDSIVLFADDFSAEFQMPAFVRGNLPFVLNVYVPDADATWAQALAAGCTVKMPIADQFWGDRYGHVLDPFGFTWSIATRKEDLTRQEIEERGRKAMGGGHA
jgi:PhnB protein